MSTYFNQMRSPWTSIRIEPNPRHLKITMWDGGACSGTLLVDSDNGQEALASFFENEPVCQRYAGKDGPKLVRFEKPRTDQLLSDDGQICSYSDMLSMYEIDHDQEKRIKEAEGR